MKCKKCGNEITGDEGKDYYIGVYNDEFHIKCPAQKDTYKREAQKDAYKRERYRLAMTELRPKFYGHKTDWIQLDCPVPCMVAVWEGSLEKKKIEVPFTFELNGEKYHVSAKLKNFWRLTDKGRKDFYEDDK